jgi:hypothetical protein
VALYFVYTLHPTQLAVEHATQVSVFLTKYYPEAHLLSVGLTPGSLLSPNISSHTAVSVFQK